ncbi:hypothetical protein EST38_g1638 [Candolleomyces aberdarensis]|uniref:Nephrocystin 3-like N-terminal domain-containing protein n=1 Tax=Candolleomyces aberdarensis TaxID=2316362 RepID=A0A4Q2DWX0_9AGAR|nr:hypothetical protein EST38_g1638 [Candolleomyces aberdarensis]
MGDSPREVPVLSLEMKTPESGKKTPKFLNSPPFSFFRSKSGSLSPTEEAASTSRRRQSNPEVSMLLNAPPGIRKADSGKSFPRTLTIGSTSESSTLLNPNSPGFTTLALEGEKPLVEDSEENGSSLGSVQIAGITVLLSKPTARAVYLKLRLKGNDFVKLPLNYDHTDGDLTTPLRWNLQPYLTIRRDSNLVIQVRRRRVWPKNPVITEAGVSFSTAVQLLKSSLYQDDATVHQLIVQENPLVIVDLVAVEDPLQLTLDIAADKVREIRSVLDNLGKSRRFLELLLAYSAAVSEIDPIAKAVLSCVKVAYKQLLEHEKCDRVVVNLADNMARTLSYISDVEQFARIAQLKKALEDVRPLMEETANFILRFVNRSRQDKLVKFSSFNDEVEKLKKKYNVFQQQFDRGLSVQATGAIENVLQRLVSTEDDQILQELKPKGIELNTRPVAECMKGTRTDVLFSIDDWIDDVQAPNILWVRGFPGVGKSSIAATVTSNLRRLNRLGSRFIFQREKATVSTPNILWRSVAFDLARLYPSVRRVIVERLKEDEVDVETCNVKSLFRELIEEPLEECDFIPPGRLPVIVVDALDECGGRDGRRSINREGLLQTLKRWATLPSRFKLIVTSRIEDDILKVLDPISECIDLSTGDNVNEQASHDIRLFLKARLAKIAKQYPDSLDRDWPGPPICDSLTLRAAGLFQWAKTALEFVNLGEPTEQLQLLLDGNADGLGDLTTLYAKVLEVSFRMPSEDVLNAFQGIVGAIVFAKRPLTREECLKLLPSYSPTLFDFVRKGLRSVLDSDDSKLLGTSVDAGVLRFSHQSFVEFLLSPTCLEVFRIDETMQHRNLAQACLDMMIARLEFNIVRFPTSYVKNAALVDLDYRAETLVTTPLTYACRFWTDHLQMLPWDEELFEKVKVVIYDKLLFWLEVLSVIGEVYSACPMVTVLRVWCQGNADSEFMDFLEDTLKFLDAFSGVMAQSLPHIYISALPFAPTNSKVAQRFRHLFPRSVRIEKSKFTEWPRVVFAVDEHEEAINCATFSCDGRFIVSGSNDMTVRVWDSETGDLISGPMEEHDNFVGTVAFSRDGRYIASGSDDCTIRIWDTESGDLIAGPLKGHENVVKAVAFSNDGAYLASASVDKFIRIWDMRQESMGELVRVIGGHEGAVTTVAYSPDDQMLVSGSADRTVRVWDASSGELLYGPLEGHFNCVNCVAFSPDGQRVASASEDEKIQFWDFQQEEVVLGPLEGHTDGVTSIAFSPDGRKLVSGSHDGILILWDTTEGTIVCEPFTGHRSGVTSVAFSPRGHRILSSSCDNTLLVWDAESALQGGEEYPLTPFLDIPAHQDNVKSVAFSPDGSRIVSGSDDETIRLWDAATGEAISDIRFHCSEMDGHHWQRFPLPPSHRQGVDVVAYSPDGEFIASAGGNSDGAIAVWHSASGELHHPILRGHGGGITSLVFLPSSYYLVSSSYDGTIRIWDIESGETLVGPLSPHDGWITSVAVSPDGASIASASNDRTIRVFAAATMEEIRQPLVGHEKGVNCVIFSPCSKYIISASHDLTIRVWDVESGEVVRVLDTAHEKNVLCLALSPDGRYIASGSVDSTIKLWDFETGMLALGPLEGHIGTIFSVAFNNDGSRLVSSSEDETIRVWDVSSIDIRGCFVGARPAEFSDDSGYRSGWIVQSARSSSPSRMLTSSDSDDSGSLLLWVPPWCRTGVWWPRNTAVISEASVKLDLSKFAHGEQWYECYQPEEGEAGL